MKPVNDNYRLPFPKRLRLLMDDMRVSQQELADFIGVKRQTVAQWKDGNTVPDIYSFQKIAAFFKVPHEYLLGDTESRQRENMHISEELGLSDKAIAVLQGMKNNTDADRQEQDKAATLSEILSNILESDKLIPVLMYLQDSILQAKLHATKELLPSEGISDREKEAAEFLNSIGKTVMNTRDMQAFYLSQAGLELHDILRDVSHKLGSKTLHKVFEFIAEHGNDTDKIREFIEGIDKDGNGDKAR